MAEQGIMDYSLLLVIETVKNSYKVDKNQDFLELLASEPEKPYESRNQIKHGDKVYHIGIIDYLQAWNLSKKIENKLKGSKQDISAVPPFEYSNRFYHYAQNHIFKTGHSEHENILDL